ncbi:hypothetical protein FHX08_003460 [Rhizobium sp. BK529]|nr:MULTISPECIES: hypothetical protein [unclassified Rhizobium]MBB3593116.1 hypothetical protein [Rhizobium sp. BK529]
MERKRPGGCIWLSGLIWVFVRYDDTKVSQDAWRAGVIIRSDAIEGDID